jgi:plasmid stabilization system protein ParE
VNLPVRTTPEADVQIRTIDDWWCKNRPAATNLFTDELAASFDIIGQTPNIGRMYRQSPVPDTRRVLLKGCRYHVYYAPGVNELRVLAVWHAQRGVGPPLRAL